MKARHVLMGAGVAITGWLALFGDKTPSGMVAEPVVHTKGNTAANPISKPSIKPVATAAAVIPPASAASDASRKGKNKSEPVILILRDRTMLIGGAHDFNKDDALFASQSWVPPPPPPTKPVAPPPPTAPDLPFTFIGKKLEDAVWEIYLSKGDHTFIVREKSVIEANYRIESIKPPTMTLMYLPLNQMQTLTIGGAD